MTTTPRHPATIARALGTPLHNHGLTPLEWDALLGIDRAYDHFDQGVNEDSGIWDHVHEMFGGLTGTSTKRGSYTFRSLVKKGVFASDIQDGMRWYALTAKGADLARAIIDLDRRSADTIRKYHHLSEKPAATNTAPHSHSSHAGHGHPLTPSARAACRKARSAA